jgi:hypothetical protein
MSTAALEQFTAALSTTAALEHLTAALEHQSALDNSLQLLSTTEHHRSLEHHRSS